MTQENTSIDYTQAKAWPFVEANKILTRIEQQKKAGTFKGYALLETGYGPSGLPHIGTFGEVFRTTMVLQALKHLAPDLPAKLICFSDDMDGLRKVPTNVPNQDLLQKHINKPLTEVPDPFEKFDSFGAHNNAMLCDFLDRFHFDYEFRSSSEVYKKGEFNNALLKVLEKHDEICDIVKPTLGEERRKTYSPFLPICPETRHVLQVPVIATNVEKGTITYRREDGVEVETEVTNGNVKLQWKADWSMRWYALGVDYEMSGKDLIDSVNIGQKICKALGGIPPVSLTYEHFVDENGAKISKSKGNGLTIEEWLQYADATSLAFYMFPNPQRTKKLFLGVIPKMVDDYEAEIAKYNAQSPQERLENPVWHLTNGAEKAEPLPFSFNMLLNLTSVAATPDEQTVWGFIRNYRPDVAPENAPRLADLVRGALKYYEDTVAASKSYRTPEGQEVDALQDVIALLDTLTGKEEAEDIQTEFYTIGKKYYEKKELRNWFALLYECLFGFTQGPRLGSFVKIYGVDETKQLVENAIQRQAEAA